MLQVVICLVLYPKLLNSSKHSKICLAHFVLIFISLHILCNKNQNKMCQANFCHVCCCGKVQCKQSKNPYAGNIEGWDLILLISTFESTLTYVLNKKKISAIEFKSQPLMIDLTTSLFLQVLIYLKQHVWYQP